MTIRTRCPDCGSVDLTSPDADGWQYCNMCGSDFHPDWQPGDDPDD